MYIPSEIVGFEVRMGMETHKNMHFFEENIYFLVQGIARMKKMLYFCNPNEKGGRMVPFFVAKTEQESVK